MTLSGLNIGLSALYAQRRGLEVTGHNIANANTDGYSRQRVRLAADGGPTTPAVHSRWNGAGNGVVVQDVQRLRDVFLETRSLRERGTEAGQQAAVDILSRVEDVLGEPGEVGLQSMLSEFWSGWDDIANRPTDLASRSQLLARAETLATGLNRASDRLETQWAGSREELGGLVADVNATASAVADLNKAVVAATNAGLSPNDLADQRDVLVQRLAELTGATTRAGDGGSVDVYLGGSTLVRGSEASALEASGPATLGVPAGTVSVRWAVDGRAAALTSGTGGGLLAGLNDTLPRYRASVDEVAIALRDTVNAVHTAAFTPAGGAGGALFTGTRAGDLAVAVTDPALLAASGTAGTRDGSAAARLAELGSSTTGPDAVYRGVVVRLGVEAQTAERRLSIQSEITRQVDGAREAEAGVNLDEEMGNMLAYQRAYEGSARFITAVDQMLETLISRTGLVGR